MVLMVLDCHPEHVITYALLQGAGACTELRTWAQGPQYLDWAALAEEVRPTDAQLALCCLYSNRCAHAILHVLGSSRTLASACSASASRSS